ncbi:hypothetical protein C0J52_09977 [Blattella germanica]|nr:hypothetical protein C0J52_09977 [Blattella germanica]
MVLLQEKLLHVLETGLEPSRGGERLGPQPRTGECVRSDAAENQQRTENEGSDGRRYGRQRRPDRAFAADGRPGPLSQRHGLHAHPQELKYLPPQGLLQYITNNGLEKIYEQTSRLIRLVLTFPITCSNEMSNCTNLINRIKTFLKNSMKDARVSQLSTLAIEKSLLNELSRDQRFRDRVIDLARALKSAQAQENSGGEYDFSNRHFVYGTPTRDPAGYKPILYMTPTSKSQEERLSTRKARTSIGSAETFIPKPGPSTMISGSDESSSLDVYDRTEKILGFSEPESQAETLTEGEFMEEKFMMTVKEEPIELPAEEAQAFPLEIQLSTSSAPVVPELVDKKPITPTIESWPISNQGTESSTLALPPQAVGSIPATSNLASPLHSKPAPARRKKPCTITAEPTEESLTMSLSQFPSKTLPVQDSSAKEVELDETAQEAPVREPSIVNVEAVLRRLRMEKLLLEIDKLKLEQKKLTAEKTNILLKKSIFSLRKTLMSEDDDSLVQKTVPVVTPPVARVRDEVPVTTSLPTLGSGVSLHSVHEQVAPQTGIERETENGRKLPPKQTKAIQSATPRSKENESQRISREPTQKSAQNQQIAKDPLATGGDRIKIAESRKVVSPSSEDVQNSRVIGETVKVSSSSSSQRKTTGPKSALHPGETKTTLVQPNQNLGTSSASDDICRVGLVATNQKSSEHSEIPCATPSYECGGSMPIADGDQGQTEDYIVRSMCDIVEKGGPADVKRERNIGLTEIHGTESGADSRLSSGLESEGPKAGTSWLENAQARISKRFQQISDPEASLSKRMRMDDDDSVP